MTARDLAVALDAVVQMLRERNLIKADGTTHPGLDPIARLTATIYIQAQRRGPLDPSPTPPVTSERGKGGGGQGEIPEKSATRTPAGASTDRSEVSSAAPAKPREPMASKYPGKCWRCLKGYPPGEPILSEKVDGVTKWGHADCVRRPR